MVKTWLILGVILENGESYTVCEIHIKTRKIKWKGQGETRNAHKMYEYTNESKHLGDLPTDGIILYCQVIYASVCFKRTTICI